MTTWKLWAALVQPPVRHPIYRRVVTRRAPRGQWRVVLAVAVCVLLVYGCYQASFTQSPVRLVLLSLTAQDVLVVFIGFNVAYGCLLAWSVSLTVARAREQQIYDMLCLTPGGEPGALWALGTGAMYQVRGFVWFRFIILLISAVPMLALAVHLAIPLLLWGYGVLSGNSTTTASPTYLQMVQDLLYGLTLAAAFYLSCVQSVVMSLLLGMLTPESVGTSSAQVWTVGIFLLLQIFTFLLTFIFSLFFLPAFYKVLHLSGGWADLSVPLVRLLFFYALREGVNTLLWRGVERQANGGWSAAFANRAV
jgi:hypothetical protein